MNQRVQWTFLACAGLALSVLAICGFFLILVLKGEPPLPLLLVTGSGSMLAGIGFSQRAKMKS
ncbi:hypothetical protein [Maricaulis sp. CAU 1757]